jgi:Secretion system C-terminal sorting domain
MLSYGVDTLKFMGVTYDTVNNYSKKFNVTSPSVIVVNYLLNTTNQFDTTAQGYNLFKIDMPNINIPANGKLAITSSYISGDTYLPFDTIYANGNVKYNYFSPMYIEENTNLLPYYNPGDYNCGYLQTFPINNWPTLYIPMFAFNTGTFKLELPSIDMKLKCATCDSNVYQIYQFGTTVFDDTLSSCNPISLSTLNNTTIPGVVKQWIKNGLNIAGATNTQYTATQSGSYVLKTTINGVDYFSRAVYVDITSFTLSIITSSNSVCAGGTVTITANGAPSIIWSPTFTNGAAVTVFNTTTYTATGTNANGCASTATVSISVIPVNFSVVPLFINVCSGDSITLTASGTPTFTWSGGINNGVYFIPNATSQYTVTATTSGGCTKTSVAQINMYALPNPVIVKLGNVLSTSLPFSSYQWYFNGAIISGATSSVYSATQNGFYSVLVTNTDNCKNISANYQFTIDNIADLDYQKFLTISPNPTDDILNINFVKECNNATLQLYSLSGKLLKDDKMKNVKNYLMDMKEYANGIYFLQIKNESMNVNVKVIKN